MEDGMPILSPAPFDASPDRTHPVPETLGRHSRSIPILSGDPRIIPAQLHDAAIFEVVNPDRVTSMQGDGTYDTPAQIMVPTAGVRVMKVGRTTGLTRGTVRGVQSAPVPIPYNADRFKALVYIGGGLAIVGDGGQQFSQPGDSGSLVVTEDGQFAVGLIAAGSSSFSICLPLEPTLNELGVSLVSSHGV
ncbi:S1 family peptidase [Methylobacterium tardum]|nr:S1 family peptidase [Methylobacterium tardum]URD34612.1 S1 family peptidase [Methylobacterium tardum]